MANKQGVEIPDRDSTSGKHFCCSPNCPGYGYRASERAHPARTCGPWPSKGSQAGTTGRRKLEWRFNDRRELGSWEHFRNWLGAQLLIHCNPNGECD